VSPVEIGDIKTLDDAIGVIRTLLGELATLRTENQRLSQKVTALEAEVARLKKDSSTSSKPPSSDIVKPLKDQRQPGKRKIGGQPGHSGKTRTLLPPEQVDEVVPHVVELCPDCGAMLTVDATADPIVQQVVELLEKPVKVWEHQLLGCWCDKCRVLHYAPSPIQDGQLLGPRLQALVGYMKGNLGASFTELKDFFDDVLKLPVSRGMLCQVVQRVSNCLRVPYEEVEQQLPQEPAINIDETGWRDNGKGFWVWLFCTETIAFFSIHASRGSKVLRAVLGETFGGAITSDFYSAYVSYTGGVQQFCLAHLIRDIKFLTTLPDSATKKFGTIVLAHFRRLFRLWNARDQMPVEVLHKKCNRLRRRLFTFLHSEKVPEGGAKMKKRLVRYWKSLFRFVEQPQLYQPTNNRAEQNLRHAVRLRRQTQGSRSPWGRDWAARIMTVIVSCRRQKRSPWEFICDAIIAQRTATPPPSLLVSIP
jgi:transposase